MNRRLLLALWATLTLLLVGLWQSLPAGADYSDHGEPQTSLVASTHPSQYTPGGSLPRTGFDPTALSIAAVAVVIVGAVLLLASTKRSTR